MNINTKKNFKYLLVGVIFIAACQESPRDLSNMRVGTTQASRFQTVQEDASEYAGSRQKQEPSGQKTEENQPMPQPNNLPVNSGPSGPINPPIPTDDELVNNGLFGGGPLVAPYARCGDGIRQPLEDCDLGNGGQKPDGSTYPNGNVGNQNGCNILCGKPFCGNGVTEKNEQCDDGDDEDGDGCSRTCLFERCGNFILDPGEQCDDGGKASGDGCSACCKYEYCGNGVSDAGEECDDGNNVDNDGCSEGCEKEAL